MNKAAQSADNNPSDTLKRLAFFKGLQSVTNKIHSTSNVEEIMLELSDEICSLFNADRLTLYALSNDGGAIVSKIKTGLNSFKDIRLPLTDQSIAGYAALSKKILNINDVYDENELQSLHNGLKFRQDIDIKTGYRTREVLVAPIISPINNELLGVVQIINSKDGLGFSATATDGLKSVCETLAIAFSKNQKVVRTALSKYDYLVQDGLISTEELDHARQSARMKETSLDEILTDKFNVSLAAIGSSFSRFFGVPYEPERKDRIKPADLLKNLKQDYLAQSMWLPVEDSPGGVVVICLDPDQVKGARTINNILGRNKVELRVTTQKEFNQTLNQFFRSDIPVQDNSSVNDLLAGLDDDLDDTSEGMDDSASADNELVKLVNKIIIDAYQQGASDIHIEPGMGKDKVLVRFRKDGTLGKYIEIPASYRNAIAARIKIMCDLDIAERRKPQDGKIKFKKFGPLDIELRVATLPSTGGVEDIVMRILAAGEPIPIDKLGVLPGNLSKLKTAISKPYGLFFVCGPTGSGKTTTLHSVLGFLNTPDTKIWTAEDPVEITQKGLRQVQINKKAGMDFPTIMKAFLRADPDIIMVGEMRDAETTSIGIEASLTGHLVFATLHTNSAPESVTRLLDMGMDPFNFSDAILGILAQRLAKRLCKCKVAYTPSEDEMELFFTEYCTELIQTDRFKNDMATEKETVKQRLLRDYGVNGKFQFHRPKGCPVCGDTGYKGRVGLHELMLGSDEIKRLIQEHARVSQLFSQAVEDGMLTLKMDGMEKVLQGITDIKQVRAVCIK